MILSANTDSFGCPERFASRELRHILDLIDGEEFYPRYKEKSNGNKNTDK